MVVEFYGFGDSDDEDGIYNQKEMLNLTLRYNESWKDLTQSSNCIINMSDLTPIDDTFENIVQVSNK